MTVIAELGDLDRFESPRQLMGYLGIVVGEDGRRATPPGSITKTGNSHLRWMLAESANAYEQSHGVAAPLQRQEGQSQEVKALSWRAQYEVLLPPPQALRAQHRTQQGDHRHRPRAVAASCGKSTR